MQEPRFFRWLKSMNALIFFGVGLLLFGLLGYAAYQIYQDRVRDRSISSVVNLAASPAAKPIKVSLGSFSPIAGTPYFLAPINAEQTYRQEYYDKAATSTRNYLVVNANDQSAVRLVPQNQWLFVNAEKVGQTSQAGLVKAAALWYQVIKTDTNGDKQLTELDHQTIALSEVTGKNYTEVVPRLDRLLGSFQQKASSLTLIYTIDQKNYITEIDIQSRKVLQTQALPALE